MGRRGELSLGGRSGFQMKLVVSPWYKRQSVTAELGQLTDHPEPLTSSGGGIITDTELPPTEKLKEEERLAQRFWRS